MHLDAGLEVIHQPLRLQVMALLYRHGDVGFTETQKLLGSTPGNLDAHCRKLAEAGLLKSRRALMRDRFEVRLRLTPAGVAAFEAYLGILESFLASAKQGTGAPS